MVPKAALWKMRAKEPFWQFLPQRKFIIHKFSLDTGNEPRFGGTGLLCHLTKCHQGLTSGVVFIHIWYHLYYHSRDTLFFFLKICVFFDVDHFFFNVFVEFVTILLLLYVPVSWPRGMWDPSSPTRVQTRIPPTLEGEVPTTGLPGKFRFQRYFKLFSIVRCYATHAIIER